MAAEGAPLVPQVFVSYSTADGRDARALAEAIEACGLRAWFAPEEIRVGDNYAAVIYDAICASTALVALLTPTSLASDHVKREFNAGLDRGLRMLPVMRDEGLLFEALPPEWRYWLGTVQLHRWTSATETAKELASLLLPREPTRSRTPSASSRRPQQRDDRTTSEVRSILTRIARSSSTLGEALRQGRRRGIAAHDVVEVANELRESGLISFDGPPEAQTSITLRK